MSFLSRIRRVLAFRNLLVGLAIPFAGSAFAASSYNPGDLLVSFRANGTGSNPGNVDQTYTFTLGPAWQFRDGVQLGVLVNISADLETAFGPNWATRSDIYWGIVGNFTNAPSGPVTDGDPVRTIYASQDQTTLGVISAPPNIISSTTRASVTTNITGFGNAFKNQPSAANPNGSIIATAGANNDYTEYATESLDFNSTFGANGIEGNSPISVTETALDLYRIVYSSNATTYEGTFNITATGDVVFTIIPEPSALGLVGLGAFLYSGIARFRRRGSALGV